ncbi:MAG TPA: FAD-binding protein [Longimicrobiaceae bacterium]|nr:FAD-binding protein [Longimicrobiaceae bacterium]
MTNREENLEEGTAEVHCPASVEEVQDLVKSCRRLRVFGSGHSFNGIADGAGDPVSLRRLNRVVSLDRESRTVTVEGGTTYDELAPYLHANGYALHNLASLPHISIAGACSTATHGSGSENGNLATAVFAIELVDGTGEVVTLSRRGDGDRFRGAVVGLGGVGVVTKLTLDLQPAFDMTQVVYRDLPMGELENHFDAIMASGYSVSLFTDWTRKTIGQVWIKRRAEEGGPRPIDRDFYGARLATRDMHPVDGESPEPLNEQRGVPGPWYERLPHFRMDFRWSPGSELQSEYFVPVEHGYDAIMAVQELHERIAPHQLISEIRTVAADRLWMSPCYGRDCVAIHTTWKPHRDEVVRVLPLIERQLTPYDPVPHWGKLFTMPPAVLQSRFARLADFRELLGRHDPEGRFRNEFLSRYVHGG